MEYAKAYLSAFKTIFTMVSVAYYTALIFVDVPRILAPYIAYLCVIASFGGPLSVALKKGKPIA